MHVNVRLISVGGRARSGVDDGPLLQSGDTGGSRFLRDSIADSQSKAISEPERRLVFYANVHLVYTHKY